MGLFRRILVAATLAGLVAGVLLTIVHHVMVVPLIAKADAYEQAAHEKKMAQRPAGAFRAGPAPPPWQPAGWVERVAIAGLFDVLAGIVTGLILVVGYVWRGTSGAAPGLLWGLGAYAAFGLAPALGLPPELSDTASGDGAGQRIWWLATVALTAVGLAVMAFAPRWFMKIAGLALLAMPHLIGAPNLGESDSTIPLELRRQFVAASLMSQAVFWVALGVVSGYFFRRLDPSDAEASHRS